MITFQVPILTTLDLIDALVANGAISDDERLEHRTLLRRAGYSFVPVNEEELNRHLDASSVDGGQVIETAELKAIRENILRVRMSDWLQLPNEAAWLNMTLATFLRVLKDSWTESVEDGTVSARSHWLSSQIDIRGWAHRFAPDHENSIVTSGRATQILMLLTPPADTAQTVRNAYWKWAEEYILSPIKEQDPEMYDWMVQWYQDHIDHIAAMDVTEGETT